MAVSRSRDKVRDGYLGDLPEPIRTKVMNIHKLIRSTVDSIIEDANYDDLKASRWAMSCLDDFCVMPKDKSDIGSVRVFKSGPKKFRCSIQITGQFRNHQYGWIEELIHDFIKNVHATLRPEVRKKYDMTIINEGRTGNPFERFTIETSAKVAEEIWNLLDGTKTKTITESGDVLPTIEDTIMELQEAAATCAIIATGDATPDDPFASLSDEFIQTLHESITIDGVSESLITENAYQVTKLTRIEGTERELEYAEKLFSLMESTLNTIISEDDDIVVNLVNENGWLGLEAVIITPELLVEGTNEPSTYFSEKATREEYAIRSFKKQFNYTPDGYITINGRRIHVDMDLKSPTIKAANGMDMTPRCTCLCPYKWDGEIVILFGTPRLMPGTKVTEWQIGLGRGFFNIGGSPDKREAILQHEMGHLIHQLEPMINQINNTPPGSEREKMINLISKYEIKGNDHAIAKEFEADRFAANRTSVKAMKTGLRRMYKYSKGKAGKKEEARIGKLNQLAKDAKDEGMSIPEYKASLKDSRKEMDGVIRVAYQNYLKDPKYPRKLGIDQFSRYFVFDGDGGYEPDDDVFEDGEIPTKRRIAREEAKGKKMTQAMNNIGVQEDKDARGRALRDKTFASAKYLKKEAADEFRERVEEAEYITEKVSRIQRNLMKFKEKYNYQTDGYCTINGRKIRVDLNINDPTYHLDNGKVAGSRCNCIGPYKIFGKLFIDEDGDPSLLGWVREWQIVLDRSFFELSRGDRRDAVLQHEMGHFLLQLDRKARNELSWKDKRAQRKLKKMAEKIIVTNDDHADPDEYEADAFAASKTSSKALRKGLQELYKKNLKASDGIDIGGASDRGTITKFASTNGMSGPQAAKMLKSVTGKVLDQYREIYNTKYLNDPKYPSKVPFDRWVLVFDVDIETGTYTPGEGITSADLTRKGSLRYRDNLIKTHRRASAESQQSDMKPRMKALKSGMFTGPAYMHKESSECIEMDELFIEECFFEGTEIDCGVRKLPKGLAHIVSDTNGGVKSLIETMVEEPEYADLKADTEEYIDALNYMIGKKNKGEIGRTFISKDPSGTFTGEIQITPMPDKALCRDTKAQAQLMKLLSAIHKKMAPPFNKDNPGKKLVLTGPKNRRYFIIALESAYAERLFRFIKNPKANPMTEATEAPTPDYNTDMTEAEAKRNMRTLSQGLINDFKTNKSKKMTQYTANIYANIITKNLLPRWAGSFRKFSISLDDYQSFHTVEFKVPKMTQDFVGRFIHGRENLDGFLHRQAEIKMKISPRVFHTMKSPDDAYNFFKAAITYYDKKVGKAGEKLMAEAMKLTPSMKQLVGTTKLSGIVTFPMTLLFVFDDVDMSNKNTFQLSQEDIRTVSSFIRNISSHYAAPEKEKKQIVDDVQKMVKTLREACSMDENLAEFGYLPEAVTQLFAGRFDKQLKEAATEWEDGNVDYMAMRAPKDPKVKVLTEAFGVKKLKKIPADLVAYIQIETEAIKDANDKMMISSYCLSKIEIVEWYIELLNVGSKKYVVPHTKPWLENMRTQLLACFKKIMATPIPKADRPIIDIKYPPGYEG